MALDPDYFFYSDGTITLTNGSDLATGTFTAWDPAVLPFDFVFPNDGMSGMAVIKEVLGMSQIRLAKPWPGPTLTDAPYFMVRWTKHTDPKIYALRLSDYLTRLKAIPENLEEIGQQVATDAAAVASALPTITQAASDVEADRQAVDIAAAAIEVAQIATLEARDETIEARDVAVSAAGSTQSLWDTRAAALAANIPAPVQYLRTAGYAAVGDGGGALYDRIAAPSTAKAWHFQSADGAWWALVADPVRPRMLGAKGVGTDDTAALQAAIDYSAAFNVELDLGAGDFGVAGELLVNTSHFKMTGAGLGNTTLRAVGNFGFMLRIGPSANYCRIQHLTLLSMYTTTRSVRIDENATVIRFSGCEFSGDVADNLVYSMGQNVDFDACSWYVGGANTLALTFDCYNQNGGVTDCRIGGPGKGIRIARSSAAKHRVEGLRVVGTYFINTGEYNIEVGPSLFTVIDSCVLDQAGLANVKILDGADNVTLSNNWVANGGGFSGTGVYIYANAGNGHIIQGNQFQFCAQAIVVDANPSSRISNVTISGNSFQSMGNNTLVLDSVNGCIITGNTDGSLPGGGSWMTKGTFGPGRYIFDNNKWHTTPPGLFHSTSSYRFGNEIGIRGSNEGATMPGASVTSMTIPHGLFTTPDIAFAQLEGHNSAVTISNRTNTTFTVSWNTAVNPVIHWQAKVAR
ncbi:hypothetical protein [Microvirga mediterraneensis]|uniref:Uncharacterized protein n=1 Tax=Microvirga mediterraneensis TaxID=2754695 RepID=A0A838BTI2_9HYPH|nr:hypothetical protein [Microvirga mediterraneensis]MBA1157746.1 hypothetical protein [Microvirga mediterraneensis]